MQDKQPGELIDERFRIAARVGEGGMGVVYRAVDTRTGEPVALKLIRTRTAEDVRRAMQEVELLAKVASPGIVRHIADGLTVDAELYLAMAWIDGITVAERLETDGFTLRDAVTLARAVAAAAGAAHAANILHRDIKPTNIILPANDPALAMLIDFGLARLAGAAHPSMTRTGTAVGTPGYMSPEQARGLRELQPASDVFAIGLVLYECAAGRPAFTGATLAAQMMNVVFSEPHPIGELCPEAPPELAALLARMLAKAPEARPRDGVALARELAVLGELPDGPRRDVHHLVNGVTRATPDAVPDTHCLVLAARGLIEDTLDPPDAAQQAALARVARTAEARFEVLATGAAIAHLHGVAGETAHRAADCALAMKAILPGWALAISTVHAPLAEATEDATALLARAARALVISRAAAPEGITIDPATAQLVGDAYVILRSAPVRLVGRR